MRDSIKAISYWIEYIDITKCNYEELSEQYISALMKCADMYRNYPLEDDLQNALQYDLKAC